MDKYNEFKEELSVYENKSKARTMLSLLIHKFFRMFTTKAFDFVVSLSIILTPVIFLGFNINLIFICVLIHFVYWISIYRLLSKKLDDGSLYHEFTLRIRILEDIISRK
jgi:hypothetical protein